MALPNPTVPTQGAPPTAKPKVEEPDRVFFNEARMRRTRLRFHLRDGRQIEGTVRSFGTFTLVQIVPAITGLHCAVADQAVHCA